MSHSLLVKGTSGGALPIGVQKRLSRRQHPADDARTKKRGKLFLQVLLGVDAAAAVGAAAVFVARAAAAATLRSSSISPSSSVEPGWTDLDHGWTTLPP